MWTWNELKWFKGFGGTYLRPDERETSDTFNHGVTTISISPHGIQEAKTQPEHYEMIAVSKHIEQELIRIGTKLDTIGVLIGVLIIIVLFRGC